MTTDSRLVVLKLTYDEEQIAKIPLSDSYTAQTIFDQVWEAPYEWFRLKGSSNLPTFVQEVEEDGKIISEFRVDAHAIIWATLQHYFNYYNNFSRSLVDYLEDLDANDVDGILQLVCFGEYRYG